MAPISLSVGATATSCGGRGTIPARSSCLSCSTHPRQTPRLMTRPFGVASALPAHWGYGGVRVGNLFAWRTPYPQALRSAPEPIGHAQRSAHCTSWPRVPRWWLRRGAYMGCGLHERRPSANGLPVLSTRSASRSPVSRPIRSVCGARARPFCWIGEGGLFESLLRFVVLPTPHFPLA